MLISMQKMFWQSAAMESCFSITIELKENLLLKSFLKVLELSMTNEQLHMAFNR